MHILEILLFIAVIVSIIVGLPCLLVRPLFVAFADRVSGKKGSAREIQEMKNRIESLETEVRCLRVQVISIESHQEFSNGLLEDLKLQKQEIDT